MVAGIWVILNSRSCPVSGTTPRRVTRAWSVYTVTPTISVSTVFAQVVLPG
jgi:hypothetical protein